MSSEPPGSIGISTLSTAAAFGVGPTVSPVAIEGQFGWLHISPASPVRRTGFVFCTPPDRDGRCAHRPMRDLAQSLARLGYPVLRLDPLGVGDSLDLGEGDDPWPVWRQGIEAGRDFLKAQTGIDRAVMTGLRIAGRLAAEVAAEGLVLLAPVASGTTWLRELKLAAAMSGTGESEGAEGLESEGLYLSPAAVRGLAAVDLDGLKNVQGEALVFAQNLQAKALGTQLADRGMNTKIQDFPGYADLLQDSHSNKAPQVVFDEILEWTLAHYPEIQTSQALEVPPTGHLCGTGFEEWPVNLERGSTALLTRPEKPGKLGVIICNTSRDPRAGIGRLAVKIARNLAQDGVTTLRFDFPGIGDSEIECRDHMYLADWTEDFARSADYLRRQGCESVTLIGVCSGAFHVIRAMSTNSSLDQGYCVSSRLVWRAGDSLEPQVRDQGIATARYLGKFRDRDTWQRLLRRDVDVLAVLRTLARRSAQRAMALLNDRLGAPLRNGVAAISARGGSLRLVMGLEDSALDELESYFGSKGRRLTALPGMSMRIIPDLDHGVAKAVSRDLILADLRAFLKLN